MSFTVFLGNLPVWVTADDIKGWLTAENLVADAIKVIRNPETQESKGFAFIDAPNTEEMNSIIRRFDRAPLEDRLLRANPAQPPRAKGQGEGRGEGRGRPMGPPGSGGHGGSGHSSSGHGFQTGRGFQAGHGEPSTHNSPPAHSSTQGSAHVSGQTSTSAQASGASPSPTSSGPAAGTGESHPPRRKKGSAVKRSQAGGPQSPFAEELAKAL